MIIQIYWDILFVNSSMIFGVEDPGREITDDRPKYMREVDYTLCRLWAARGFAVVTDARSLGPSRWLARFSAKRPPGQRLARHEVNASVMTLGEQRVQGAAVTGSDAADIHFLRALDEQLGRLRKNTQISAGRGTRCEPYSNLMTAIRYLRCRLTAVGQRNASRRVMAGACWNPGARRRIMASWRKRPINCRDAG